MDKTETAVKVGNIIKAAREKQGWSRYHVSMITGLGETQIRQIEDAEVATSIEILNILCKAVGARVKFPIK